jgi:hypothetical protein
MSSKGTPMCYSEPLRRGQAFASGAEAQPGSRKRERASSWMPGGLILAEDWRLQRRNQRPIVH